MDKLSLFFKQNFLKQPMMSNTFFALIPLLIAGVYFYGLNVLILFFTVLFSGVLTEYLFAKLLKQKVSLAIFVSVILYVLILPPNIPLWIAVTGIIFGISFGKMLFGGFGKNVFNPAITSRAFIYVSFGPYLTSKWFTPFINFPAGFSRYKVDTITLATPLKDLLSRSVSSKIENLFQIDFNLIINYLFGNKSGSIGEGFIILIILVGIYLIYKKYASYLVVLSGFFSFLIFSTILFFIGKSPNPFYMMLTGGWFFGLFFMITDPVTSTTTKTGKIIYGSLYSFLTVVIRIFGIWTEGAMFAILICNTFAPLIDFLTKKVINKKNEKNKKE
ncbi:MAG: RnfABCDGE type electron transport complex subunit D [Exilispira sp.]